MIKFLLSLIISVVVGWGLAAPIPKAEVESLYYDTYKVAYYVRTVAYDGDLRLQRYVTVGEVASATAVSYGHVLLAGVYHDGISVGPRLLPDGTLTKEWYVLLSKDRRKL